ncbi:FAD-dependent monooxygenase [Streptomyces sp. NPDC057257]|uniref:FAD-dependent monooxygenase n=1 Tax=Streptomyces sp. NPDC057257 TaxID=3346071 RepID=UPI00363CB25B
MGAGPVGLAAAHELVRRGVAVRLIEARGEPVATSRAIATHPRTLELYDQMGLVQAMIKRGQEIRAFTLFQDGRRLARLDADYSTMPTRFPFTLAIEQTATEDVFRGALADLGVPVEWGTRLEHLEQDDEHVAVTLGRPDGSTETLSVPWLVGCDGGHSTVRKILDLPLTGEAQQTWLLADAPMTTDLPPNSIYWVRTRGGTLMAVPLADGRWRLLDTADVDYDGDPDRLADRFARKLSYGIGAAVRIGTPTWVSRFTAQQRMVPAMRVGRCLVAGDAAHVHSPASGQGMNTGIQEAVNLSWKLAMVVDGHARPELLDSYSAERVPVGRALLDSARQATRMIELRSRFTDLALPVIFGVVSRVAPVRRRMQREMLGGMSGLLLSYATGSLSPSGDHGGTGPGPGARVCEVTEADLVDGGWPALLAALRTPRWLLLVAPDTADPGVGETARHAERAHGAWLSVLRVTPDAASADPAVIPDAGGRVGRRLGLAAGGWLLVRPDGYVLARGRSLTREALTGALAPLRLTDTADVTEPASLT